MNKLKLKHQYSFQNIIQLQMSVMFGLLDDMGINMVRKKLNYFCCVTKYIFRTWKFYIYWMKWKNFNCCAINMWNMKFFTITHNECACSIILSYIVNNISHIDWIKYYYPVLWRSYSFKPVVVSVRAHYP